VHARFCATVTAVVVIAAAVINVISKAKAGTYITNVYVMEHWMTGIEASRAYGACRERARIMYTLALNGAPEEDNH
jgi:hypothetical protein